MILGIGPDCSGALVILDDVGNFIDAMRTPTIKDVKQSKVNGVAIVRFLIQHLSTHAYIEKVHSILLQGVSSTFTFGHSAGVAEGIIQGLNISYTMIMPQAWKKSNNLVGTDKDATRSRATQLYPSLKMLDKKGEGQAIADALIMISLRRLDCGVIGQGKIIMQNKKHQISIMNKAGNIKRFVQMEMQ